MQAGILLVFLALCLLHEGLEGAGVPREKALALFNKCKQETHATEDVTKIIGESNLPTSPEGKCMLHCVLESKKLMKGSRVDTLAFADYFENLFAGQPRQLEAAARAIALCGIQMQGWKVVDKCDKAFKVFQCGKQNGLPLSF